MGKYDDWKCRASATGYIASKPKGGTFTKADSEKLEKFESKVGFMQGHTANQATTYSKLQAKVDASDLTALSPAHLKEYTKLSQKLVTPMLTDENLVELEELRAKKNAPVPLSQTALTHCQDVVLHDNFGRRKELNNKQVLKGNSVEEDSFALYQKVTGKLLVKNEKFFNHHPYLKGTPDNKQGCIRDIKSSWDLNTFPMFKEKLPDSGYKWQVKSYMVQAGMTEGHVTYCLVDTPRQFIEDELWKLDRYNNIFGMGGNIANDESIPLVVKAVEKMIFSEEGLVRFCNQTSFDVQLEWFNGTFVEIPAALRVKNYEIEHDPYDEDFLIGKVVQCRQEMNRLYETLLARL